MSPRTTSSLSGTSQARMRWPAQACIDQGADVVILEPHERNVFGAMTSRSTGAVVSVMAPADAEVLVIQRPTSEPLVRSIPFLRAKGVTVVVDFDDDLSNIHPTNPAFAAHHPTRDATNHWRWAEQACRDATMVTVSTPALAAKYGAHGRVRVLRNCVPDHYLDVEPAGEKWDGFGWAGSLHSHPDDLQALGPTAARLVRAGHEFTVIGPPSGVGRVLGLDGDPPGTGLVAFDRWPSEVARLSVGIAPLASTRFNSAKSNWKLLEMLATGVPWVASDAPEYARLAAYGAVVSRPREWMRELGKLLSDASLRQERAERGRQVARTMTYSQNAHLWQEAWTDAVALERSRSTLAR